MSLQKTKSVGIFDSGLGAITVLKEIVKLLPNEDIVYYGDTKNSPYGEKTKDQIQDLCVNIADFLTEKKDVKAIVIACNTATGASLEVLQEKFDVPVIGVIQPGATAALNATKNNNIAVFSTVFTAESNAYKKDLDKLSDNVTVTQIGCPEFFHMIEDGWEKYDNSFDIVKKYIDKIPEEVDTLILGCTHYPLAINDIKKQFSKTIVDPSKETALVLKNELIKLDALNPSDQKGKVKFYVSGDIDKFKFMGEKFLGDKIEDIQNP